MDRPGDVPAKSMRAHAAKHDEFCARVDVVFDIARDRRTACASQPVRPCPNACAPGIQKADF
jgi:hypothetical protein